MTNHIRKMAEAIRAEIGRIHPSLGDDRGWTDVARAALTALLDGSGVEAGPEPASPLPWRTEPRAIYAANGTRVAEVEHDCACFVHAQDWIAAVAALNTSPALRAKLAEVATQLDAMRGERDDERAIAVGWERKHEDLAIKLAKVEAERNRLGGELARSLSDALAAAERRAEELVAESNRRQDEIRELSRITDRRPESCRHSMQDHYITAGRERRCSECEELPPWLTDRVREAVGAWLALPPDVREPIVREMACDWQENHWGIGGRVLDALRATEPEGG